MIERDIQNRVDIHSKIQKELLKTKSVAAFLYLIPQGRELELEERAARKVYYADRFELEQEIMNRRCAYDEDDFAEMSEPPDTDTDRSGGLLQTPVQKHEPEPPAMPLRTD